MCGVYRWPGDAPLQWVPTQAVSRRRDPLVSNPLVTRAARWGVLAWAAIGVAILAFIAYRYLLYPIRIVFAPLALAIVIVFLCNPVVSLLERRGVRRGAGTVWTYVLLLSLLGAGLAD